MAGTPAALSAFRRSFDTFPLGTVDMRLALVCLSNGLYGTIYGSVNMLSKGDKDAGFTV